MSIKRLLFLMVMSAGWARTQSVAGFVYIHPQTGPGATDLATLINDAFASCSGKPCTVVLPPQNAPVSYKGTIMVPSAMGQWLDGSANILKYTGAGDAVLVQPLNSNDPTGGIRNLQFEGTGNNSAVNVIHQLPRMAFRYDNVAVANYVTANALLLDNTAVSGNAANRWPGNVPGYSERTHIDISSTNNAKGVVFKQNGGTNSFARTHVNAFCTMTGGTQACVTSRDGAFVYGSNIVTDGNGADGTRFIEAIEGGTIRATGYAEGEGGGYGFYVDGKSFINWNGDRGFDVARGDYNAGPSSRLGLTTRQGECMQAGYFNLGLPQERNSKWCVSPSGADLYTVRLGAERRGSLTVHTRGTSGSDPEADARHGRDTIFQADATGVKAGTGFEDGHASIAGADLAVHGVLGVESKTGLNGTTYATETIDEVNHRFLTRHYGGIAPGQPSIPLVDQWYDFSTADAWINGETTSASRGVVNKSLTGNYDAKSFSAGGTAGWTGTCASGHALIVKNGIVTGCN